MKKNKGISKANSEKEEKDTIDMFVKAREKRNLVEKFVEVVKVEKYLASISSH